MSPRGARQPANPAHHAASRLPVSSARGQGEGAEAPRRGAEEAGRQAGARAQRAPRSEAGAAGLEPATVGSKGQGPPCVNEDGATTCGSDEGGLSPQVSPDPAISPSSSPGKADPIALAQALLTQAELAPDPTPLIAAAEALLDAFADAPEDDEEDRFEALVGDVLEPLEHRTCWTRPCR